MSPAKGRLLAVAFGCVLVLLFAGIGEVILRAVGFRFSPWYLAAPEFVAEEDGVHLRTASMFTDSQPYGWPFCVDQRFTREKPPGTIRIAIAGESNVRNLGLCERLAAELGRRRNRPVEIINVAFAGCGSERVLLSVREALDLQPDAVVVYAGHNEFISVSNPSCALGPDKKPRRAPTLPDIRLLQFFTKQWLKIAKPRREALQGYARIYDDRDKAEFYRTYEDNLSKIALACQVQGVPVIFCTLAYNYARPPADYAAFPGAEDAGKWDLARLRAELEKNSGNPLLEYWVGRRLLESSNTTEATFHLEQAFLRDANPIRASTEINRIVSGVAKESHSALVDIHQVIGAHATNGLPGDELFTDHCHLNEAGKKILEDELAVALDECLPKK